MTQPGRHTIVIDAGHGGTQGAGCSSPYGAISPRGVAEKDVTLAVARRVARRLGARLTRTADINLCLAERCPRDAGVFLSLHANAGPVGVRGSEIWVHSCAGNRSIALARHLDAALRRLDASHRGSFRGDLGLLDPTRLGELTAATLVEMDYLSDPSGEARLRSSHELDLLADALSAGVDAYYGASGIWLTQYGVTADLERAWERANPAGRVQVTGTRGGGAQYIFWNFGFESSQIKPEWRSDIEHIGGWLARQPGDTYVSVDGHSSSTGSAADNRTLSLARAHAVRDALVASGASRSRVIAAGFGEVRPWVSEVTPEDMAKNRRVEVRLALAA